MPRLPGVAGTTGYEWLNTISRVLVDGGGLAPLERTWREFTGERADFAAMLEGAKHTVIDTMLASEFTVLARALARIAAGHFSTRDFTLDRLRAALQLYVIEFPVYRTYVDRGRRRGATARSSKRAIARARARWRGPDPEIFDFLRDAITLDLAAQPGLQRAARAQFRAQAAAVHRAADGQVAGGHRVLSLSPAAGAQRGRRRSGGGRAGARRVPRRACSSAPRRARTA